VAVCDLLILAVDGGSGTAEATPKRQVVADLRAPSRVPQLPPTATRPTVEGAKDFVLFWFDTLNYSLAHSDDDLLASHTGAGCRQCSGWLIGISRWRSEGLQLDGGLSYPLGLAVGPFSATEPVTFAATFANSPATLTDAAGTVVGRYPGGSTRGGLTVLWANGRWQMADVFLDVSQAGATP
jgi:hypothetical protein